MSASAVSANISSQPLAQIPPSSNRLKAQPLYATVLNAPFIQTQVERVSKGQPSLLPPSRPLIVKGRQGISGATLSLIASNKAVGIIETPLQRSKSGEATVPRPSFLIYQGDLFPRDAFTLGEAFPTEEENPLLSRVVIAITISEEPTPPITDKFVSQRPLMVETSVATVVPASTEAAPKPVVAETPVAPVPASTEPASKAVAAEMPVTPVPAMRENASKLVVVEPPVETITASSHVEASPKVEIDLKMQAAKGVAMGVVGPVVTGPIDTLNALAVTRKQDAPKISLKEGFNNYVVVLKLTIPGKVGGALAFMCTYPFAARLVNEATDSPFLREVVPYGICATAETIWATPISVFSQKLRLDPNQTILGVVKSIQAVEGFRGYYRGVGLQLTANIVYNMIFFPGSKALNSFLIGERESEMSNSKRLFNGFLSGLASSSVAVPFSYPIHRIIIEQRNQKPGTDNPPLSVYLTTKKIVMEGAARPGGGC